MKKAISALLLVSMVGIFSGFSQTDQNAGASLVNYECACKKRKQQTPPPPPPPPPSVVSN